MLLNTAANLELKEEILWERVYADFGEYVNSILANVSKEKHYITPRRVVDARSDLDEDIIEFLGRKEPTDQQRILVLSAPAGVGKTTLARHITLELARTAESRRIIPIFVEANHWRRLRSQNVDTFWAIVDNSIRSFSPDLRLNNGLFEHLLCEGTLCFIFDGFDELCGDRNFSLAPREILDDLIRITEESDARILLTTRTTYWNTEIGESCSPEIRVVELDAFNKQQVTKYFEKCFNADKMKQDNARSLYTSLLDAKPVGVGGVKRPKMQFFNLPVCVGMIAQCIETGEGIPYRSDLTNDPLLSFLTAVCIREKIRQSLAASADTQIKMFIELAAEYHQQDLPTFNLDDLEILGLPSQDTKSIASHALLRHIAHDDRYTFAFDFLYPYFRAVYLFNSLTDGSQPLSPNSLNIMKRDAAGTGFVFDHLSRLLVASFSNRSPVASHYRKIDISKTEEKSFMFHVLCSFVREDSNLVTGSEKARILAELLCGRSDTFIDLRVEGLISGFDFSGMRFERCVFKDCKFVRCSADTNTEFTACTFIGELEFTDCRQGSWAGVVPAPDTRFEDTTALVWEGFVGGSDIFPREAHVMDALRLALAKFWKQGSLRASIRMNHWKSGTLGHSIYCQDILDAMLKVGLIEKIAISGVKEGGLAFQRAHLSDLQKFMDGGQLVGKIRDVYLRVLE